MFFKSEIFIYWHFSLKIWANMRLKGDGGILMQIMKIKGAEEVETILSNHFHFYHTSLSLFSRVSNYRTINSFILYMIESLVSLSFTQTHKYDINIPVCVCARVRARVCVCLPYNCWQRSFKGLPVEIENTFSPWPLFAPVCLHSGHSSHAWLSLSLSILHTGVHFFSSMFKWSFSAMLMIGS